MTKHLASLVSQTLTCKIDNASEDVFQQGKLSGMDMMLKDAPGVCHLPGCTIEVDIVFSHNFYYLSTLYIMLCLFQYWRTVTHT